MPVPGVILHPTDYSEHARQAFNLACRIARSRGDRLIVMHVAEPVRNSSLGMVPVPPLPKGYRGAWESRLRLIRPTRECDQFQDLLQRTWADFQNYQKRVRRDREVVEVVKESFRLHDRLLRPAEVVVAVPSQAHG